MFASNLKKVAAMCVAGAGLFAMAQSTHAQTLPYPPYNGTTLVVDDDKVQCPTAGYSTIQSAVDAASPGSTIHVCPGTYAEQVTITKSVQIYGDNGALVMPTSMSANVSASEPTAAVIAVLNTENVNIIGLIIDGSKNGITECAPFLVGVYYHGASGTLYHNTVRNMALPADLNGCQSGDAVDADSMSSPVQVTISNNSIVGYQKNGVTANDAHTTATIQNNVVSGVGRTNGAAQNGIQIGFGATGSITNNSVSNNFYLPCNDVSTCTTASTGILIVESDGVAINGNTLESNQLSIYVQGNKNQAQQNLVANSAVLDGITFAGDNNIATLNRVYHSDDAGVVVAGNNNQIFDNEIGDAPIGILKVSGTTGNTIIDNHVFSTFVILKDPAPNKKLAVQPKH
jgi:nitrous oxidase accessory protein NosD